jgi:hypothetical protein
MKRAVLAGLIALFPSVALADDGIGRYQALALPQTGNTLAAETILFLDTRDGHVWEWRGVPAVGSNTPGGGFTYLGKLIPGDAPAQLAPQAGIGKCFTFNGKQFCE